MGLALVCGSGGGRWKVAMLIWNLKHKPCASTLSMRKDQLSISLTRVWCEWAFAKLFNRIILFLTWPLIFTYIVLLSRQNPAYKDTQCFQAVVIYLTHRVFITFCFMSVLYTTGFFFFFILKHKFLKGWDYVLAFIVTFYYPNGASHNTLYLWAY